MQAADILTDSVNILRDTNCTRLPFVNSPLYNDYPSESETIVSPYTWLLSLLASSIVGSTGVIPMILIPRDLHSCKFTVIFLFSSLSTIQLGLT